MAVSCLDDSNFVDIKICFFTTDRIHRKSGQWQSQHSALSLVSFDIVGKTESYTDKRTSQQRQRSPEEKQHSAETGEGAENSLPIRADCAVDKRRPNHAAAIDRERDL